MLNRSSFKVWGLLLAVLLPLSLGLLCLPAAPDDTGNPDTGQPVPTVLEAAATATPSPAGGGQVVILDASGSVGPAGSTLTFAWAQTAGTPAITLTNANAAQSGFLAPTLTADAVVTFTVTVSDGTDTRTASVDVTIAKTNRTPVANAGADQPAMPGSLVTLDGSGSSDADQDPITYSWVQKTGAQVTLQGANTATASFIAPADASQLTLTFELTVSDGTLSATDTVIVSILANSGQVIVTGPSEVSPLGVIPDDLVWLIGLRNVQGLFDAVDGVVDSPGRARALLQMLLDKNDLGDINLPDLNGALAIFQLKPVVMGDGPVPETPLILPTAGLPCVLFELTPKEVEDVFQQGIKQSQYKDDLVTITVQETALSGALAGVTRVDILANIEMPPGLPPFPPIAVLMLWVAPLGDGQFTVMTGSHLDSHTPYIPAYDIEAQWPYAGDIRRVIAWQGQSIEQRFDAKWVTSFKAGHALAWAEGDFVYRAMEGVLDGILSRILPDVGQDLPAASQTMAELMGRLPLAVTMPNSLIDGNPVGLDDVCLVLKVAEPGVGQLWARFEDGSNAQQSLAALPTTGDSMLVGLPDEPVFAAAGMIGPWVDKVLNEIDDGQTTQPGTALNAIKPLMNIVKNAATGQTLMMAGSVSELRNDQVIVIGKMGATTQPASCGPKVGGALVVTGPGVGDSTSISTDVISRLTNEIARKNPGWIMVNNETGETINGQPVVWLMMSSTEMLDGETVPYPFDDLWNGLLECDGGGTFQRVVFEDGGGFQWDILTRVVRVDANHVAFSIDPLGSDHAIARLTGMFNLIVNGQAPLADRPLIKNARATLADNRTAEAYLATWPDPNVEKVIINGQFLKFQYDLAIAGGSTPPVETDPGDTTKAMGLSFGQYNNGRIAEVYLSIPIEDLLKGVLKPKKD